jgi:hypothetical protein
MAFETWWTFTGKRLVVEPIREISAISANSRSKETRK